MPSLILFETTLDLTETDHLDKRFLFKNFDIRTRDLHLMINTNRLV